MKEKINEQLNKLNVEILNLLEMLKIDEEQLQDKSISFGHELHMFLKEHIFTPNYENRVNTPLLIDIVVITIKEYIKYTQTKDIKNTTYLLNLLERRVNFLKTQVNSVTPFYLY